MQKKLRNMSIRRKIALIYMVLFGVTISITGGLYYGYAQGEIVKNFTHNAEILVTQTQKSLESRLDAINRRAFALLTNQGFIALLTEYMRDSDLENEIRVSGEMKDWLKELNLSDTLIHSSFVYMDSYIWDDYTKVRNHNLDFESSIYRKLFDEMGESYILWGTTSSNELFVKSNPIIPYIRKFMINNTPAYLVIQIDQKQLLEQLGVAYVEDELLIITDEEGEFIAGTAEQAEDNLRKLSTLLPDSAGEKYAGTTDGDEEYFVYKDVIHTNQWNLYLLKAKSDLFASIKNLRILILFFTITILGLSFILVEIVARQLTLSLSRLQIQMQRMRDGESDVRFFYPYKDEIGSLAKTFNYMADKVERSHQQQEEYIKILKEEKQFVEKIQKQKRKAELTALQSQIRPHFLYNTLNAITWLASDNRMEEVKILSKSLGRFFRISLSKGKEIITLSEEIEHVVNYLEIQKIRYPEEINYHVDFPESLKKCTILKLVLQPLVENSICHGAKGEKGVTNICITVQEYSRSEDGEKGIRIIVRDDGKGIPKEKRNRINEQLQKGNVVNKEGYGIYNVNERIRLYFGTPYGLWYESQEHLFTEAILSIPLIESDEEYVQDFNS